MAGNTRGRLKERFEGIHRNFDWSRHHLESALDLIQEHHPHLSESIKSLSEGIDVLDELAMGIYARL